MQLTNNKKQWAV